MDSELVHKLYETAWKWSDWVQKGRMLVYVSPYLMEIVAEGWLWLDTTSEPQGLGGPISSKDSANYRNEDTK